MLAKIVEPLIEWYEEKSQNPAMESFQKSVLYMDIGNYAAA